MLVKLADFINESKKYPKIWYHGSKFKFDKFKYKKGTLFDINYNSPIFLTSSKEFAKYYAGYKTPYIYTVEILTDNIFDFRNLPTTYDLLMFFDKNVKSKDADDSFYDIGNKLLDYIYELFPDRDCDRMYNDLLDGDYSSIEQTWIYDWLKDNNYDGCYIVETKELNLLIFDESKIKILSIEVL